jgi:hypothetical protein
MPSVCQPIVIGFFAFWNIPCKYYMLVDTQRPRVLFQAAAVDPIPYNKIGDIGHLLKQREFPVFGGILQVGIRGLWELPCKRKCSSTLYSMFSIS